MDGKRKILIVSSLDCIQVASRKKYGKGGGKARKAGCFSLIIRVPSLNYNLVNSRFFAPATYIVKVL
jgi:hypothetical protein